MLYREYVVDLEAAIQAVLNEINVGLVGGLAVAGAWTLAGWVLRMARFLTQSAEDRAYNDARDWDDEARGHHHNW